jgi:N-acetylglucosamine-6-phosphate deacetylase
MRTGGLVDLQVNGFAGVDFNSSDLDAKALDNALSSMLATGVTTCLPTVITASADALHARLSALDRAVAESRLGPILVPGYHLEGPFLNSDEGYRGCHPPDAMISPDADLVFALEARLSRPILLVTVAPEQPGSEAFIRRLSSAGKIVAIGHSSADAETVRRAVDAGARMSTHLGNGVPQTLPKLDNTIFAQLADDGLSASFIADGIHLPGPALKAMLRAKGTARSILVTDAVSAAATTPGRYDFAGMTVEHGADGSVRVPGGSSLAGSALTMDRAIRHLVRHDMATPQEAVLMASDNPRNLLAPAIAAHNLPMPHSGSVTWTSDLEISRVEVDGLLHVR